MTSDAAAAPPAGPPGRPPRRGRRGVWVVLLVLAGAACCAGAAALTWWSAQFHDPLVGTLTTSATGNGELPELVPVALVALAGLGAMAATRGWARRLVGVLLLAGGVLVAVRAVLALTGAPTVLLTDLQRPATQVGSPVLHPVGPVLAVVGGLLIGAAGALLAAGAAAVRRMGTTYDSPVSAGSRTRPTPAGDAEEDAASLWRALDGGSDPSAEPLDRVKDVGPGQLP